MLKLKAQTKPTPKYAFGVETKEGCLYRLVATGDWTSQKYVGCIYIRIKNSMHRLPCDFREGLTPTGHRTASHCDTFEPVTLYISHVEVENA